MTQWTIFNNKQFLLFSTRTLYLLTAPEVLHAGTPTPLALTVFADFPVKVIAEVTHDNVKVAQTEDFQGGDTDVTYRGHLQVMKIKKKT